MAIYWNIFDELAIVTETETAQYRIDIFRNGGMHTDFSKPLDSLYTNTMDDVRAWLSGLEFETVPETDYDYQLYMECLRRG